MTDFGAAGVVFAEAARTVVLHDVATPIGPTIGDLKIGSYYYIISDLAGYTVDALDDIPALVLRDGGGEMVLVGGLSAFSGLIEGLTNYTILGLNAYTISQLDDL